MYNIIPTTDQLPYALYRAAQVRALDNHIIQQHNIPGIELMERAGNFAWNIAQKYWSSLRNITVICGVGNNGGDGYVVARLAMVAGLTVKVLQLGNIQRISGDALAMMQQYQALGGKIEPFETLPMRTDLIVDAIFGTGLERDISGIWAAAIEAINEHSAPVLALDIPSGLNADTGKIMGCAVKAQLTVTFIALKQGLFTADGSECCGKIKFASLDVPALAYRTELPSARRIDWQRFAGTLSLRPKNSHKGHFGHVLIVGGLPGMSGAVLLAAIAALRCGAGLVTIATHPQHSYCLNVNYPEIMCCGITNPEDLTPLLTRATVIVIGPGLGQSIWAIDLLHKVFSTSKPLIVDADALNFLSLNPFQRNNWILTPHPGEAARLLNCTTTEIQHNRFFALTSLQECYNGIIVLKGAGTLISNNSHKSIAVCSDGNSGMASGGMGDVLTGVIASFVAQGWDLEDAACMGVSLHAATADKVAFTRGERGMLASDLFAYFPELLNYNTKNF